MSADTPQTLSAFPDPPNFYTHFTPANLAALRSHRQSLNLGPTDAVLASSLPASSPLHYLLPPPPPASGSYWSFSEFWQTPERHPSLEENGITRLYSEADEEVAGANRVVELRRLSKSLLLSFLELVGVMAVSPEDYSSKTADLQTILFNMHHIINQYRPHQARETLCLMMEEQLERVRRETEVNYAATRRVEEALAEAADVARKVAEQEESEKAVPRGGEEESEEEKARRRDREGWRLIMEAV